MKAHENRTDSFYLNYSNQAEIFTIGEMEAEVLFIVANIQKIKA